MMSLHCWKLENRYLPPPWGGEQLLMLKKLLKNANVKVYPFDENMMNRIIVVFMFDSVLASLGYILTTMAAFFSRREL